MLTKVEVRTVAGMLLVLTLNDSSNGFVVQDISGLDPVKATLVSSSFATMDGTQFQSARRETRNIMFSIGFEPDFVTTSVRDLRKILYSIFTPKSQISLRFFLSEGLTVDISGYVESCETDLFSKDPQVAISVMCFDPDFAELTSTILAKRTTNGSSEFKINYGGTTETGMKFILNVDRALTEFTIYHRTPDDQTHIIDFAAIMEADDVVTINTSVGQKAVTLLRDSTESSLLYGMASTSEWLQLQEGDNYLRFYATGETIPFTVEYTTKHGGL